MIYGTFIISIPVLILIGIDIILILLIITKKTQVRRKILLLAILFIIWSIIVTATRFDISSYILPLVGFIIMWIPLLVKIPMSESQRLLILSKWYCRGLVFSFIFAYQDILSALFKLPKTEEIIPFAVAQRVGNLSESLNIGIDRINSLMTEPSEYATFLVFGYICLEYLSSKKIINKNKAIILKLHTLFFLLFTFSLSGLVLFAAYLIFNNAFWFLHRNINYRQSMSRLFSACLTIGITFVVVTNIIPDANIAIDSFIERTNATLFTIGEQNLNTSGGARINSLNVAFDSLQSDYGIIGQGFGNNVANWLMNNYGNLSSEYARGDIFNIYAAVLIGVGVPGLLIFMGVIYQSFNKNQKIDDYQIKFFFTWLLLGFTLGSLLYYSYWGAFYVIATEGKYLVKK